MTSRREGLADRKLIVSSCLDEEISQCQPLPSWPPAHEPVLQAAVTLQKKSSEPKSRCVRVPIVESLRVTQDWHRRRVSQESVTIWCNTPWWDTSLDSQLASQVIDWVEPCSVLLSVGDNGCFGSPLILVEESQLPLWISISWCGGDSFLRWVLIRQ